MTAILSVFLIFLFGQIWSFSGKAREAEGRYAGLREELDRAREDKEALERDFEFYLNPANLEKELRARFNYRLPGEKLIIIVPAPSASGTP